MERLLKEIYPEIYHNTFECNNLSPAAVYSINAAQKIIKDDFIKPYFLMYNKVHKDEKKQNIGGLEELYNSIHTQEANCFFLIDCRLDDSRNNEVKAIYGGGGMGKTTILCKTYMDNRVYSLLFLMKDYKKINGWGNQIKDKCRRGKENWILFDGLNEMGEQDFKDFNEELKEVLASFNNANINQNRKIKFVFSARNLKIFENLDEFFFYKSEKRI